MRRRAHPASRFLHRPCVSLLQEAWTVREFWRKRREAYVGHGARREARRAAGPEAGKPHGPSRDAADAGFTLAEVMIAGTLGLLLVLPAAEMLSRTYRVVTAIQSRARQSQEARQVFALLGDGTTVQPGLPENPRKFRMVEGVRSRQALPQPWTLRSDTGQFVMNDGNVSVAGNTVARVSVTCRGTAVPVPACTGTETRDLQGWLGAAPQVAQNGKLVSVIIDVTDPFQVRRNKPDTARVTETFRARFTANVERNP